MGWGHQKLLSIKGMPEEVTMQCVERTERIFEDKTLYNLHFIVCL